MKIYLVISQMGEKVKDGYSFYHYPEIASLEDGSRFSIDKEYVRAFSSNKKAEECVEMIKEMYVKMGYKPDLNLFKQSYVFSKKLEEKEEE